MDYVYMVRCADDTLYTGWSTDPFERVKRHNKGNGAKYTRSRRPVALVYYACCENKKSALQREAFIKKMTRQQKLALIDSSENLISQDRGLSEN